MLVVGDGPVAAAAVLDAATRGLSACLAAPGDLAAGAARFPVPAVPATRESTVELRRLLGTRAPHLVDVQPRLYPLHRKGSAALQARLRGVDALRIAAGIPARLLPPPRRIPAAEALAIHPGLHRGGLRGALLGFDGWIPEPGRLTLAACRTAAGHGALIIPHLHVDTLLPSGARVTDTLTGAPCAIRARTVIDVRPAPEREQWALVRGGESATAAVVTAEGGSYPAGGGLRLVRPVPEHGAEWFDAPPPGSYRVRLEGGIVAVRGGCPVTARAAAQAALDRAVRASGLEAGPCVSARLPLAGAVARDRLATVEAPRELVVRYGTDAARIAALGAVDPALGRSLAGTGVTAAEVVFAVRNEGACRAEDVVGHRLGLAHAFGEDEELTAEVGALLERALDGLH